MQKSNDLGMRPRAPKKPIPGTGQKLDGTLDYSFVLDEKEKVKDDYAKIKDLIWYYTWIGRQQLATQRDKIAKKFNLAYGVIDLNDYVKDESEYKHELEMLDSEPLDYDLKFYPIIPNIVNVLTSDLTKQYTNYSAIAVNREAVNEIIEQKNEMLRQAIVGPLQQQYQAELQEQGVPADQMQDQMNLFMQMPKIQNYMTKDFRLDIEKWANHQIQIDNRRFKMKELEKSLFFNKLVTDLPFIHINLLDGDYKPEVLDPRHCFYLRSPLTDDISEAVMFGFFEYDSPLNVISRFGDKLTEVDIEKLENLHVYYRTLLTMDSKARYNLDTPGVIESAQNYLAFRELAQTTHKDSRYRDGEYKERLLEVCTMYLQVPRKIGKLTVRTENEEYSTIVEDSFKPSPVKATYSSSEKSSDTLIYGEHVDWFYINELWKCLKINMTVNPNPDNNDDIYIILEKFPIQLSNPGHRYGSLIPVHGGPKTNKYNEITSLVDKCKPWQVFYNYLWNRNSQLLQTEIGRFFALNQNVIPQESMGEDWGPNNILKWAISARDVKIAGIDTSMANTGGTNVGLTGGYGQLVDLTVTEEVIQKAKLAEICKNECLVQVGITPQFLGDIGPRETTASVAQGISRSVTQIKYLYDEHFTVMEKARQTMLEFAKYLAIQNDQVEQMYVNDDGERIVFQIPSNLMLHQLGVYVSSDMDDNMILEQMKMMTLQDNTMGAELIDKVGVLGAKSISEVYEKVKQSTLKKQQQEAKLQEQQAQQQQQVVESQERQLQAKLQQDAIEAEKKRAHEVQLAEIKVVGSAQLSEGGGVAELEKLKLQQQQERTRYADLLGKANMANRDLQKATMDAEGKKLEQQSNEQLEREKLKIQREKIAADIEKSRNQVVIAKVNK